MRVESMNEISTLIKEARESSLVLDHYAMTMQKETICDPRSEFL